MESYNKKYRGTDDRLSVIDILQKVGSAEYKNGVEKEYKAVDIDSVKIAGNTFKNYGQYQFIWEKSFFKQPERSTSGVIDNLDSYPTFLTPHLIIDFSVMSIDDYRKIMKLHYSANEFVVECYDPIYDEKIMVNMYFATEEMAKLYTIAQHRIKEDGSWEEWIDLVGVTEYKVELIGTNRKIDNNLLHITYVYNKDNYGSGSAPDYLDIVQSAFFGTEKKVGNEVFFIDYPPSANLKFKHWVDSEGLIYTNGTYITINSNITLYAVWQSTSKYTLSFNYGLSEVAYENEGGIKKDIIDREVEFGKSIGVLPTITTPKVRIGDKDYEPYDSGKWYKTPVIQDDKVIENNTSYWATQNTIIYALYKKKPFSVVYYTLTEDISVPTQTSYYGDSVYLPTLIRSGYKFDGWYTDANYSSKFLGTMPPHDLTLYAKWSE
jgi:uncharacterized repeat protein (TIGR02543 family)